MKPLSPLSFTRFCASVGLHLTPGQYAHDFVAYDGREPSELEGQHRELARQIFGPIDEVPAQARRVSAQVKGRDVGGSRRGGLRCLHLGCTLPLSTRDPDELVFVLFIGPKARLSRVAKRFALSAARKVRGITIEAEHRDGFMIVRHDGRRVVFECVAAGRGGDTGRSVPIVAALLDEACFFRDEQTGAVNDKDVFNALIPRLERGGQILIVSSPWTESGLLFTEYTNNFGAPSTSLAAFCPTLVMRDDAETRANVELEYQRDPENARREFGAEFLIGGAATFFDRASTVACVDRDLICYPCCADNVRAYAGGDLGLVHHSSALTIVHKYSDSIRVAEVLELRPKKGQPLALDFVLGSWAEVCARHRVTEVVVDHHMLSEASRRAPKGLRLTPAPAGLPGKVTTHTLVRDLMRTGGVKIPGSLVRLVSQLLDIVSVPLPGGGLAIRSPQRGGAHGDVASSAVLAIWAARQQIGASRFRPEVHTRDFDTLPLWGPDSGNEWDGNFYSPSLGSKYEVEDWLRNLPGVKKASPS